MLMNADAAYNLTIECLSSQALEKLQDIEQAITRACKEGNFSVIIDGYVGAYVKKVLENHGYTVTQYADQRDGCNYVIKWEKKYEWERR